jgi:hypothetical protein
MLYQGVRTSIPYRYRHPGSPEVRSEVRRTTRLQTTSRPNHQSLIDVVPVALHRQTQHDQNDHALAGRAVSGIAVYKDGGTRPRVDRVWHPADFPKGYHALPRGQACKLGRWWVRDVAPGTARGRAAPVDGMPPSPSVEDRRTTARQGTQPLARRASLALGRE